MLIFQSIYEISYQSGTGTVKPVTEKEPFTTVLHPVNRNIFRWIHRKMLLNMNVRLKK